MLSLNPGLVLSPSASLREELEAITKNGPQAVTLTDAIGCLVRLVICSDKALLALATLALAASGDIVHASVLGNLAAAVACERPGNVPVVADEVLAKLDALERSGAGS